MAVFAPIPSEIVRITVAANPGDLRSWRRANFKLVMVKVMDEAGSEVEADEKQIPSCGRNDKVGLA